MDKWDKLKTTIAVMNEYVYNGFMFPRNTLHDLVELRNKIMEENIESSRCPTCGSCGKESCCPSSTCRFGVTYIENLRKELQSTRKALGHYIEMMGYKATEDIIDQEIKFYGKNS